MGSRRRLLCTVLAVLGALAACDSNEPDDVSSLTDAAREAALAAPEKPAPLADVLSLFTAPGIVQCPAKTKAELPSQTNAVFFRIVGEERHCGSEVAGLPTLAVALDPENSIRGHPRNGATSSALPDCLLVARARGWLVQVGEHCAGTFTSLESGDDAALVRVLWTALAGKDGVQMLTRRPVEPSRRSG